MKYISEAVPISAEKQAKHLFQSPTSSFKHYR